MEDGYELRTVGRVRSPLTDRADAPRQGDEGAPQAWIELDDAFAMAARDLQPADEVFILTWLDRGDRSVLTTHPRNDHSQPELGVFSTRSPDRPNPIGLHAVRIVERDGTRLLVDGLEAIDGTPVVDLKPVLHGEGR